MPNPYAIILNQSMDAAQIFAAALFVPCFALAVTLFLILIACSDRTNKKDRSKNAY